MMKEMNTIDCISFNNPTNIDSICLVHMDIITVVIRALGVVTFNLKKWLQWIAGIRDFYPEERNFRNIEGIAQSLSYQTSGYFQ